ncbi:MAG TPA: PKD domain-containing protein [Patescibacteria group bacterium]|nr:PKD domain-containing protein [Patescibacteria group bacterium]
MPGRGRRACLPHLRRRRRLPCGAHGRRRHRAVQRPRASLTVTINRPPVADAGGNKEVCAGDVVVLDGSASRDPDGGLLRHQWDFGDGTGAELVNPTKTYDRGSLYPVSLTVRDESGFANDSHTDRIVVRVDESPIADAGPDQEVCAGVEVHFDGSASYDFDGVVNRFQWDFGDGATGASTTRTRISSVSVLLHWPAWSPSMLSTTR